MLRAPAAERNKEFILQVLKEFFKPKTSGQSGVGVRVPGQDSKLQVLEVASGTGQHVAHFAQNMSHVHWLPSEVEERSINSIQAHIDELNLQPNVSPPINLDITLPIEESPLANRKASFDGILCTNMIHITPWRCTVGLFAASRYLLKPHGFLITYGPYAVNGVLEPQSNIDFDMGLRMHNQEWGVRDTSQLQQLANVNDLQFIKSVDMPANNKMLIFQKNDL